MNFAYIAIEGVIGAGKTTMARALAQHWKSKLLLERFEENPFLELFYQEPKRFAFPVEMSFLADRFNQLRQFNFAKDLFSEGPVVADYSFVKTWLFASVNLSEPERQLFFDFFSILNRDLPQPDLWIYLEPEESTLRKRITERGRSYEQQLPEGYLEQLHAGYAQYLTAMEDKRPVLLVKGKWDVLSNSSHLEQIIEAVTKVEGAGRHVLYLG